MKFLVLFCFIALAITQGGINFGLQWFFVCDHGFLKKNSENCFSAKY